MTHTQAQGCFDLRSSLATAPGDRLQELQVLALKESINRHDWQLQRAGNDPTAGVVLTAFLHSPTWW